MQDGPLGQELEKSQSLFLVLALCAVASSTMIVEIVIVKFIAFKLYHHFISLIVSTVVLSFAAAGTYLYMSSSNKNSSERSWRAAGREAAVYSIVVMLSVVLFCWLPIDPYNTQLPVFWRITSVPIYFVLFAIPFFFGGLCIGRVLAESSLRPSRVLLFDLTSAAIAAATAPSLLELLGGYGVIGAAAALGFAAYFCFQKAAGKLQIRSTVAWSTAFLIALSTLIAYPQWAVSKYGMDIRTAKGGNLGDLIMHELHGLKYTYWNALARIDVSNTGWSKKIDFLYGLAPQKDQLEGRLITVDKGANTRQLVAKGKLSDQKFLGDAILAVPYVIRPDAHDALIIGGGGGIDIVVAKFFGIPRVDVVEMNPMTYKHVLLGQGDSESALYQPWLVGDDKTKVTIFNKEARHFCSTVAPATYDSIQATGVDTFTAIASGALAYSDNYLYTSDALKSYGKLLKPGGVLSLVYCREPAFALPLKLFISHLNCLEDRGITTPWRHVVVIGTDLSDVVMKPTPFTEVELQRLRDWCKRTGATLIFDPDRRTPDTPGLRPQERLYTTLGFANRKQRQEIINSYDKNITPATDDKPYFFQIDRNESWLFSSEFAYTPVAAVILIAIFALVVISLPLTKIRITEISANLIAHAIFFAMCGFSFLLFEVAIVQLFSVFVGGPAYALAVVLVSVLAGYSIGCFFVGKLPLRPFTFVGIGCALFIANMAACLVLPELVSALLVLSLPARIAFCAIVTLCVSALAGLPVPLAMESAKRTLGREIAWFWGISCAFNALGAACFPLISFQIGIRATLAIVAVLYLLASLLFATLCLKNSE